jgi:hypothetical protein
MALTVATGMAAHPIWNALKAGNVLYAAGEGRSQIKPRVAAWEERHWNGQELEGFIIADPVPSIAEDWAPFVEGALSLSPEGYALTILDTAGMSMSGENESAFETASKFNKKVRQLIVAFGGAVLAIHHVGHDAQGRPIGSSAFIREPDTLIRVDRSGKAMTVALTMTKQRDGTEWVKPKGITLEKAGDSLVAVKSAVAPQADAAASATKRNGEAKAIFENAALAKVLDAAIREVLAHNKLRSFSQREIAEMLARRPDINVGSDHLRKHVLTPLAETDGTYASKARHPDRRPSERWHHFTEETMQ